MRGGSCSRVENVSGRLACTPFCILYALNPQWGVSPFSYHEELKKTFITATLTSLHCLKIQPFTLF